MQININILVDVVAALSGGSLQDHVILMDDGGYGSSGQGSSALTTCCMPGQVINWILTAVDLQTPLSLKSIGFLPAPEVAGAENPDAKVWSAMVPATMLPGVAYPYRLTLQMGEGVNSVMHIDGSALLWPSV